MRGHRQLLPIIFAAGWCSTAIFFPADAAAFVPAAPKIESRRSSCFLPRHSKNTLLAVASSPPDKLQPFEGDVQIPSTGVSINDEMESSEKDRFETELVPITGFKKVAAQIVTTAASRGSFEPVRYLLSLSKAPPEAKTTEEDDNEEANDNSSLQEQQQSSEEPPRTFVLMDIPPFSPTLVAKMKKFMGPNSHLAAMLMTSRDGIHYDDAPAVYRMRRTDLDFWKQAFPGLQIVGYRLDIPRDCRDSVTQILDGYGPFAWQEELSEDETTGNLVVKNASFVETGRPLTVMEWDHDTAQDILRGRKPVDADDDKVDDALTGGKEEYSPETIRAKEDGKRILAVYTPGHSFGSISYIFPETGLCCSGFTIPVEDTRDEENRGMDSAGPALDCRGYITTNRGGIAKQMESAKRLITTYCDRFDAVLPSRGDPLALNGDYAEKKEVLLDVLDQYERIGKIYEELGIMSDD